MQAKRTIDMQGKATLNNKWEQDRLILTHVTKGLIQNVPNQRYLDVGFRF